MTTNAKVKTTNFYVSVLCSGEWKIIAEYESSKSSIPASIKAFYKWFDNWAVKSNEFRFDAYDVNGLNVWQWSYIPDQE